MVFTGNTAPYNVTQPLIDNDVQIVSPTAAMASLTCSLNVTIPSTVTVSLIHNNTISLSPNGNITTLLIENIQPSDTGVYQCVFNDSIGSGWVLRRNIRLIIIGMNHIIISYNIANSYASVCRLLFKSKVLHCFRNLRNVT